MYQFSDEINDRVSTVARWIRTRSRDVILFLGAGMGQEARPPLPLSKDIALALAKELNMEDPETIVHRYPLDEIAEWYEYNNSWTELCDFIKAQIRDEEREPGDAYKIAARLDFSFYVTTNYDTVLEKAIGPRVQLILSPFNEGPKANRRAVYKPHGTISQRDKKTFILTTEQYEKGLYTTSSSPFATKFRGWLQNAHVVFVGFNLRSTEFLRIHGLARAELAQLEGDMPRHIAVFPNTCRQEREFWHRRGISIIDLEAKPFFRFLDSYLAPAPSEQELLSQFEKLTGKLPKRDALDRETKRAGGDGVSALLYLLQKERIKRGLI